MNLSKFITTNGLSRMPFNGPALAENNGNIGVAWYTESNETPKVLLSISEDGGKNFAAPIQVNQGDPIGRVDLIPWEHGFMASWVERKKAESYLMMSYYKDGIVSQTFEIMSFNASRKGGFPIIEPSEDGIIVAWTDVEKSKTRVQSRKIVFEGL